MQHATFIETGEANGHRAVLGGLTALERVIRGLAKQGVTKVVVPDDAPFDVEAGDRRVPRVPHGVTVEWVARGTQPEPGQPVVRGDEVAGVRIVDDASRKKAEWAVFQSLPKSHQGPTDALVNRHFSLRITRQLCKTRLHPNHITIACLFLGLAACALVLQGTWVAMAIAGGMMQLHNILDSCDGEMARLRFQFTKSGAWLDNICDEVVDDAFIACVGIAIGGPWMWIGVAGGAARFLSVALQWEEMLRRGKGGSAFAFRFWFEKADSTADEVWDKRTPLFYVRALGRRDSYVLGFAILLVARVPEGVTIWGAVPGAVNLAMMLAHVALRRAPATLILLLALTAIARAQTPWMDDPRPPPPWRILAFRAVGDTKTSDETIEFLSRYKIGSLITDRQRAEIERNLFSSELFETVSVRFETVHATRPGERAGVVVVATLDDKHSWIVAPTFYVLSNTYAAGAGFAENNLFGKNRKLLLYAQIGSVNSFFAGGYVVPQFLRNHLSMRVDVYLQRKIYQEYANPVNDPSNTDLARESTHLFLNLGGVFGWNVRWWLNLELRLRGAYVTYDDAIVPATDVALPPPSPDGWDLTTQLRATADRRTHRFGVTDGAYGQVVLELPLPGTDYVYYVLSGRMYLARRLPGEHMVQLRLYGGVGIHLPFHDEWTLGAATDLRGYPQDQFRGDVRGIARFEYSVPIGRVRSFYFRALGFYDAGYIGFHYTDPSIRNYLPDQVGRGLWRSDAGGGVRIYFRNIVLPLLGLDVGYGFENRATATYLQVGLTDF